MDNHGLTRAYHVIATAEGQRAALHARFATWLLATILTVAVGHNAMAKDADQSAVDRRIKSHFDRPNASTTGPRKLISVPGIRQPDFTTPKGGVVPERDPDSVRVSESLPADSGPKVQDKAPPKLNAATSPPPATPDATWSSLWRKVFASDSAAPPVPTPPSPSSEELADGKVQLTPESYTERLASHTASAADVILEKVITSQSAESSQEEVAPPSDAAEKATPEPRTPRLFKLAETVVDSGNRSGVFGLSRQAAMRGDQPMVTESTSVGTPAPQTRQNRYSLDDSSLLQPFKATNPGSVSSRRAESHAYGAASNEAAKSVFYSSPFGSLGGQLTMSTSTNYRTLAESVANSPMLSEQADGNGGLSVAMPLLTNPITLTQDPEWAATQLAAYQETLPEPPPQDGDDAFKDDANQDDSGSEQGSGNESKTLADAEKVGEEPEDNTLQFLRTQTVLLEPGESQCDIGINYLFTENRFPILLLGGGVPIGADDVLFRIRELTFPLEYRVGLLKRVQAFIGAPIGWSNTQVAIGDYEQFQNDGGFGDVDFGTTIQVIEGNAECPHGLFTIVATAPTGGDPFGPTAILAQSAPSLGQGFWSVAANALCIQTYDPMVFFYGVGAEHFFSRDFNGREIEPGNSWNYSFGVGFAVNDRVTLSTRFLGSYVEEVRVNRERILGTNVEPMSIRMAATISKPCDRIVEPFVEFGITDSAVESFFGITWTY